MLVQVRLATDQLQGEVNADRYVVSVEGVEDHLSEEGAELFGRRPVPRDAPAAAGEQDAPHEVGP